LLTLALSVTQSIVCKCKRILPCHGGSASRRPAFNALLPSLAVISLHTCRASRTSGGASQACHHRCVLPTIEVYLLRTADIRARTTPRWVNLCEVQEESRTTVVFLIDGAGVAALPEGEAKSKVTLRSLELFHSVPLWQYRLVS
jgi:hypothetical protein